MGSAWPSAAKSGRHSDSGVVGHSFSLNKSIIHI